AAVVRATGGPDATRVVRTLGQHDVLTGLLLRSLDHGGGPLVDRLAVHRGLGADADRPAQGVAPLAQLGERALARQAAGVQAGVAERTLVLRVGVHRGGAEVTVDVLLGQEALGGQRLLDRLHVRPGARDDGLV